MTRAIIGTGLVLVAMVLVAWVGLNEPSRVQTYDQQFQSRSIENGARDFEQYCSTCHGTNGEGIPGKAPELNPRLFTEREPQLKAEKWPGSLRDFVVLTVSGGRPIWSQDFGSKGFAEHMPTWSDASGGPLRDDQIQDIANFVMNWRPVAGAATATPSGPVADSNFPSAQPLPPGNAARGQQLLAGEVKLTVSGNRAPCFACHTIPGIADATATVGPNLGGVGTRAAQRIKDPTYKGKATDAAGYIHESIVQPNAFIVPDNPAFQKDGKSLMPEGLAGQMSPQDLADIIAYLLTLK